MDVVEERSEAQDVHGPDERVARVDELQSAVALAQTAGERAEALENGGIDPVHRFAVDLDVAGRHRIDGEAPLRVARDHPVDPEDRDLGARDRQVVPGVRLSIGTRIENMARMFSAMAMAWPRSSAPMPG